MVVLGDRVLKQWCDPNENIYTSSIITYFTLTYTVIIYIYSIPYDVSILALVELTLLKPT